MIVRAAILVLAMSACSPATNTVLCETSAVVAASGTHAPPAKLAATIAAFLRSMFCPARHNERPSPTD